MQAAQISRVSMQRSSQEMLVAGYATIVGAASFALNIGDGFGGEIPAVGRALIGMVGVAGGALLWSRPRLGWTIVLVWAILQIPFIAWNTDGSVTSQLFDVPFSVVNSNSVNGVVTSFSEYGINLVGLVVAIAVTRMRGTWIVRHRQIRTSAIRRLSGSPA